MGRAHSTLFAPVCLIALELRGELASFRHGGERGLGGCGFRLGAEGLEAIEVAGDLANGPLEAVDHASDAVEDGGLAFQGVDAGVPEFGFVVAESIETPGVGRELVDELALDVVEGSPGFLEFGGESVEFGGIFAGDDEGLGAWIPYLTAFRRTAALPSGVAGPVECCAFLRFVSIWISEDIWFRCQCCPPTTKQ